MKEIRVALDGVAISAVEGQSVGALLLENNQRSTRDTRFHEQPRGMFCGIGICFDCLITINGVMNQRACVTNVEDGMSIETQHGTGSIA